MIILGVNAFHGDSSAALVRDGVLIAAVEEERFRRVKHWAGFPSQAIAYCLSEAGLTLSDVDHVALNQDSRANLLAKLKFVLSNSSTYGLVIERLKNRRARQRVPELLQDAFPSHPLKGVFHNVEHHMAHLSSAFHVSPFNDAVVISVDGFGDFASTAWGEGHGTTIDIGGRVLFPHSLGIFYQALSQYLGFPHYGDEYKVMGLAPYGSPSALGAMRRIVKLVGDCQFELDLSFFTHHHRGNAYQWTGGAPQFADLFTPALEDLLGPRRRPDEPLDDRHRDIAHSVQAMYEEAFFHLIEGVQRTNGISNIALAGGCAANSVANGKIRRRSAFKRVYVQAAAGDAGGAIGSAFVVWHQLGGSRTFFMDHAYWGPHYNHNDTSAVIAASQAAIERAGCKVIEAGDDTDLCQLVATAIADGKVIGWFQGRMEWGPRALGNRSILCDPRRADMKTLLNAKIKRRESFRPFAPSIIEEEVANWFEEDDAVPFMMQVFQIRREKREQIPAVTHADGSGRLQTVSSQTNPLYHRLIRSFEKITGVPMLLNTSFNENEPVVCQPSEALDCFLRTNMDLLVMGRTIIAR
jgi:carbamoyltransferase